MTVFIPESLSRVAHATSSDYAHARAPFVDISAPRQRFITAPRGALARNIFDGMSQEREFILTKDWQSWFNS
jgi:hypothetical protein